LVADFLLPGLNGETWSMQEALSRGPVLLVFFKISCPTCQFTLPLPEPLGSVLQVVPISQDDETATRQFLDRFGVSLAPVLDKAGDFKVSAAFGITHVPSLFLAEQDGRISLAVEGFSKAHVEQLGTRFGVAPFGIHEQIPALRPG
jgi:peroxiredoxin